MLSEGADRARAALLEAFREEITRREVDGVEIRRDRAHRASTLLEDLGDLSSEVSEISVDRSGDLLIVLRGDGSVLKLADPPYRKRVLSFLALRNKLRERCPDAEYFDLRFKDRIYAKPASRDDKSDLTRETSN